MTILNSNDVLRQLPEVRQVMCLDAKYCIVKHSWLVGKFISFWESWLFDLGAHYVSDKWDCDKFARAFQSQMQISAFQSKSDHSILCGFMAVDDDGGHAKIAIRTDKGWFEIEPQNNEIKPLREDQSSIRYIIF